MKRTHILQLVLGAMGIVIFGVVLTFARLQFSESHATNLLGVLQDAQPEEQQAERKAADKNKSVADYAIPMYCCPEVQSGKSCRLFDSIDNQKCGVTDGNGEFHAGEEYQPTEAGFDACASACEAR
ncbi:MAG TPA: hypothetical protein PKV72_03115 [Candidatus Peribacteria bacterium]|nr:hypothetical protein [Candidatus Peribacteria bacterium]